jgi:hypothetical protein
VSPRVSDVVTFLSLTSIPMCPSGSSIVISFENVRLTICSVMVTEPLLRMGSSMRERW